jgi:hypothetical protein
VNWWYYLKKWYSIYPGLRQPICAPFLREHYLARRAERSWPRALLDGLIYLLFQLWVPFRARSIARKFRLGRTWAAEAGGIGRRRFADPNDIAVFRIEDDRDLDRYMRRFEYAAISKRINPAAWRGDCLLADKARFARRCAEFGLPAPLFLARITDGQIELAARPTGPAIAIKPTAGLGGHGFALLDFPGWEAGDEAFLNFLRQHLGNRRGDWLVQSRVEGHPGLRDLALNALSTARITTMRNEHGDLELVTSVLRFAGSPDAAVDNLAAGGLLAPIDPATGMLGPACYGRRPGDLARHPATEAPIQGRLLPCWPDARDLVLRAHSEAFAQYSMIGWDVGIGSEGPVLIEGNGKPGLFAAQRATRQGVGETRFGELIRYHLAQTRR